MHSESAYTPLKCSPSPEMIDTASCQNRCSSGNINPGLKKTLKMTRTVNPIPQRKRTALLFIWPDRGLVKRRYIHLATLSIRSNHCIENQPTTIQQYGNDL